MATPAASAWHRRRILSQSHPGGGGVNSFQTPSFNTTFGRTQQASSTAPDPTPHGYSNARPRSAPIPNHTSFNNLPPHSTPNLFRPPNVPSFAPAPPAPSSLPLYKLFRPLLAPFLSFAPTAVVDVTAATLVTLLLLHFVRMIAMATFGNLFLHCPTDTPRLSFVVTIASCVLLVPLIVMQLATHFILSSALKATPPRKAIFFSVALFTTPLHALGFAYLLYGPSLSQYQFFCAVPPSIFPTRNALHTPVLTAFFFMPVLYFLIFYLRLHTALPYPFPRSRLRQSLAAIPQALAISAIPGLAVLPLSLLTALLSRPPRPTYASILLTAARAFSAVNATIAAVLPHMLVHFSSLNHMASATIFDKASLEARPSLAQATNPDEARSALVLAASGRVEDLKHFAPFSDPSGRFWRTTLEAALAPLIDLLSAIRAPSANNGMGGESNLFLAHNYGVSSSRGICLNVSDAVLRETIPVVRALPTVLEASVKYDSFGVVLSTIPTTLSLLLAVHNGLCTILGDSGESLSGSAFQSVGRISLFKWLEQRAVDQSQARVLWALQDAISVCIYRVTCTFREQIVSLVEGREVGWDAQATDALRPFLDFHA